MHIYIDESGSFIPKGPSNSQASAVVGLVVPSERRVQLFREFKKFRKRVRPESIELKGSSISETEAAEFCGILASHDVLLEAIAIDLGMHSDLEISEFRHRQADLVVTSIDRESHANIVHEAWELGERLRMLPNQLFIQAFLSIRLVSRLFELGRMYYSLRSPRELFSHTWRIDAKSDRVTAMETAWSMLSIVWLSSKPSGMIPGGDYSFEDSLAPEFPVSPVSEQEKGQIDLKKAIWDRLSFVDSKADLGIQMADICGGIVTRALNRKLQPAGWLPIGGLCINERKSAIRVVQLRVHANAEHKATVANHPWSPILASLTQRAKPMVPKEMIGQVARAANSKKTQPAGRLT